MSFLTSAESLLRLRADISTILNGGDFSWLFVSLGLYLVFAGILMWNGDDVLSAVVPFLIRAVVVVLATNIGGHMVVSITGRTEEANERDQLIGCRAESRAPLIQGF